MREGRPYAEKIRQVVGHLANCESGIHHIYMTEREIQRVGYLVVSSDQGLCGGLNVNLFRMLLRDIGDWACQGESKRIWV